MPTAQKIDNQEKKALITHAPKRGTTRNADWPILEVIARWPATRKVKKYPIGLLKSMGKRKGGKKQ